MVAEAVVDRLEAIEVHEQHGERRLRSGRVEELLAQEPQKCGAIGESGELVVEGSVREVPLDQLPIRDVAAGDGDGFESAGVVPLDGDDDRERLQVGLGVLRVDVAFPTLAQLQCGGRSDDGFRHHRGIGPRAKNRLIDVRPEVEEHAGGSVCVQDRAIRLVDDDDRRRALDGGRVTRCQPLGGHFGLEVTEADDDAADQRVVDPVRCGGADWLPKP